MMTKETTSHNGMTNYINTALMDLFINRAEVIVNIDTVESVS